MLDPLISLPSLLSIPIAYTENTSSTHSSCIFLSIFLSPHLHPFVCLENYVYFKDKSKIMIISEKTKKNKYILFIYSFFSTNAEPFKKKLLIFSLFILTSATCCYPSLLCPSTPASQPLLIIKNRSMLHHL